MRNFIPHFIIMHTRLQEERDVVLYCDFHGHSRKKNVFIYGCEEKHDKSETRLHTRLFPLILSKNTPDKVSTELLNTWCEVLGSIEEYTR